MIMMRTYMSELIEQQLIIEARSWIRDCSWRDRLEELENLTDEEVIRGINRHYDGGWIQFIENCRCL
jgi:hypothetical protein